MKINTHPTTPLLTPICNMDFIMDLPVTDNGHNLTMVVVDHGFTMGVIFTPYNKTINAIETADILMWNVYKRFGLPDRIISD